jgi:hypothetical protein
MAGNLVQSLDAGGSAQAVLSLQFSINPYDPAKGLLLISNGSWSVAFNGRGSSGQALANDMYRVQAISVSGSSSVQCQGNLQILGGSGVQLEALSVAPNPLREGDVMMLNWVPTGVVDIQIYNLAGELVMDLGDYSSPPALWNLNSGSGVKVSNGIYVICMRPLGQRLAQLLKAAILR